MSLFEIFRKPKPPVLSDLEANQARLARASAKLAQLGEALLGGLGGKR